MPYMHCWEDVEEIMHAPRPPGIVLRMESGSVQSALGIPEKLTERSLGE